MHGGPNSLRVYYESGYYLFGFISTPYASRRGIPQHAWRAELFTRVLREWLLPVWVHINSICKQKRNPPACMAGRTLYGCITRVVITCLGSYQLHMQVEEESPSMHGGPNSLRVYYESGYYMFGFISTPYASRRGIPQHAWRAKLFTGVLREWLLPVWVHINSICKVVEESPSMHGGPNFLRVYYESGYYMFGFISTPYAK